MTPERSYTGILREHLFFFLFKSVVVSPAEKKKKGEK